jgi:TetR/AcrR family transcriptional regulator, repressor for divergent bdcA
MRNPASIICRGRPRCFDPEKGVEVAARLFRERGYDAVGVAELGKAIGINPPSFYAAYGSKKALLARVLERYGAQDGGFVAELARPGRPLAGTAEALFRAAAECYTSDSKACGCLVLEGTRNSADPEARELARRAQAALRERLVAWIEARAPEAAETLADYVLVALAGLSAGARVGLSREALLASARVAALGFRAEIARRGLDVQRPQTSTIIGTPMAVTTTSSGSPSRQ